MLLCGAKDNDGNEASKEEEDPIYSDIEVDDFNKLYDDGHLIEDKFGETISIKIKVDKRTG